MVSAEMTPKEQVRVIAANIKARRKELGLTQRAVAKAVGVTAAHVTQIETMTRVPDVERLAQIAEALGTTSAALSTPEVFSKPMLTA